jgi:SOS-response transcriptional repressor LexA
VQIPTDIGRRLKRARELKARQLGLKKLTLVEVGKKIGVSHAALSLIENDKSTPRKNTLVALAKLYENDFGIAELVPYVQQRHAEEIPLVGRVVAGRPIQTYSDLETIYVPAQMVAGEDGATFAVKVSGDSMQNVGIRDRDIVVLHRSPEFPPNGTVVMARIGFGETSEYTLKTFYKNGNEVILMPENDEYDRIVIEKNVTEVQVEGRFAGLIRFA